MNHRNERTAFTLMELLLVLALIVAVGAIVSPVTTVLMNRQRLNSGADSVRAGIIQARLEAMRSGRPQVFQCTIGSGEIQVNPWIDPADATTAADMTGAVTTSGTGGMTMPVDGGGGGTTITLPEGVTCESVQIDANARAMPILTAVSGMGPTGTAAPVAGAPGTTQVVSAASPVILYPDGTATDAAIIIAGATSKAELRLRGLTGDITRKDL